MGDIVDRLREINLPSSHAAADEIEKVRLERDYLYVASRLFFDEIVSIRKELKILGPTAAKIHIEGLFPSDIMNTVDNKMDDRDCAHDWNLATMPSGDMVLSCARCDTSVQMLWNPTKGYEIRRD